MDEYEIPKENKGFRKITSLISACLIVAVLVAAVYYLVKVNKPASSESREVAVMIEKGLSTRMIANELEQQGVINSPDIFVIYVLMHSAGNKIQAGTYSLNANMAIPEIVDVLTRGKVIPTDRSITIIEGRTNKQIANYLVERNIIKSSSEFDKLLATGDFNFKFNETGKQFGYEGFLFPDTYKLSADGTAAQLVEKMLVNFQDKITDQMLSDIQKQNRTLGEVLILASIVEEEVGRNKETLTPDDLVNMQVEREMVAGVFYNRLDINMPLESDATVNYITGKADRSVSIADTKIKSPYNTYQVRGLPPSPISNPGLGSIMAAIYPKTSNYLFFLNKPDGEAVFARTLAEHNANRVEYLK
jgi:UPF0755 protein